MIWDKFKNKRVILASVAILLSFMLASAAYFLLTRKSPRTAYLEAESRNFKKYSDQIKQAYSDSYAFYKPYMDGKYRSRTELTADIKSDDEKPFGINNPREIFDLIGRCKAVIDSHHNPTAKESLTKVSLFMQSAPVLDTSIYTGGKELGFTVPVLLPEKYFTLELSHLDAVYERYLPRYGMPLIKPKRIFRAVDVAETVKFSESEFDQIIQDYGTLISASIEEKSVKYGKNAVVKVGDEDIKAKEILVQLNGETTRKLVQSICDRISKDAVLLKLTCENYSAVVSMLDEAGLFQLVDVLEKEGTLKQGGCLGAILNSLESDKDPGKFQRRVKELGERFTYPGGLEMTLMVDAAGNILERKIKLSCAGSNGEKADFDIHTGTNNVNNDNFKNGFCSISVNGTDMKGQKYVRELSLNTDINTLNRKEDERGLAELVYKDKADNGEGVSVRVKLDLDRATDELTLKRTDSIKYAVELSNLKSGLTDSFKGNIDSASWKNNKQKTRNTNMQFNVDINSQTLGLKSTKLKLDMKREDRFEVEFNLPVVAEANKIRLDQLSEEELAKLEGEIEKSFGSFYINNKFLVDTLLSGQ